MWNSGSGKEGDGRQYIRDIDKTAYIRTNNIRERIGLALGEDEEKVFTTAYRQIKQALEDEKMLYILPQILTEKHVKKFWN